jgi:hypothetical protein
MKTVAVSVCGLDAGFAPDGSAGPRDLGRLDVEAVAARVLALPREVPAAGTPPAILLAGRDGARLEIRRHESGPLLHLGAGGGEGDRAVGEEAARAEVRAFVECHGEERAPVAGGIRPPAGSTPLAVTFRKLSPRGPGIGAAAAGIAIGAALAITIGPGALTQVVASIPSLAGIAVAAFLMTRTHELTVDPQLGSISERAFGRRREVCRLDTVKQADAKVVDRGLANVVLRIDTGDRSLGYWPASRANRIAEIVNDCIFLPEERRRLLRYRREDRR